MLAAACLLGWGVSTNYTNHGALLPVLETALDFGPTQAGLLTTAFFLTMAAVAFPAGSLADRFGPRRVGTAGLAVALLGNLLLGAAGGFWQLLLVKGVGAIGCAAAFVAGVRYVAAAFPPSRVHRAQGLYGGCNALGGGTALVLLPMLYDRLGWRLAFVASAVMVFLPLVAWLAWAADARVEARATRLAAVLGNARVWLMGLVHGNSFGLSYILGTWITTYLMLEKGLSLGIAGPLGSAVLVGGVVSRPLGGLLLQRGLLSPTRLIQASLAVITLCTAALAASWLPAPFAVAILLVAGLALNLPFAATMHAMGAAAPATPGAGIGLANAVSVVFVAVLSPVVGALLDATQHFAAAFLLLAAICFLTLCLSLRGLAGPAR
jgi:nitrate/nitrite transporter NarK